ncbi:hypothetical protein [Novosphingobium endophyticum]|nr:hypothetical protein [Novosphingobium endophyticum]
MTAESAGGRIVASPKAGKPMIEWPADTITTSRALLLARIKRETARRIDAVSPAWRQLDDLREPSEGAARVSAIDAIRQASNAIETQLGDFESDEVYSFAIVDNPHWPIFEEYD